MRGKLGIVAPNLGCESLGALTADEHLNDVASGLVSESESSTTA